MKPRERVFAVLQHQKPDRVLRFEVWIDALFDELGQDDPASAYVNLGQDCVLMPTRNPQKSNAWRTGLDEWDRVRQDGIYADGVVDSAADLEKYSPPLNFMEQLFDITW